MLQRQSYAPYALYGHHGRSVTSNDWLKRYLSNSATRILSAQHVSAAILLFPLVADQAGVERKKLPVEWCVIIPALGTIPTRKGLPHLATRRISIAEELPLAIRCGGLSRHLLCPSSSRDRL